MIGIKDSNKFYHKLSNWVRANLFVPDARKGWVPYAIKGAEKALAEHDIAAIVTTGPPHSTHLAGLNLKKKYNLPWLVDLRDPWTNIYYNKTLPRTAATQAKDFKLESTVLATADAVSVVSFGMQEEFQNRAKNLHVVLNGYDEQDIPAVYNQPTERFTISHVGNFFPYMDVPKLWNALALLCTKRNDFNTALQLNFTGLLDPVVQNNIIQAGLAKHLQIPGSVSHKLATETMSKANLLLFVIPNIENNALVVTGKIFEYLACKSEILPIGNVNSNVANILSHCNANKMIDYNDAQAMTTIIEQAFDQWLINGRRSPKSEGVNVSEYSRRALTGKIVDILNSITY